MKFVILIVLLAAIPETWWEPVPRYKAEGFASYYSIDFHGNTTASGEPFDMADLTAAHRTLPFGTYLKVLNKESNLWVLVRINDRGPYAKGRIIDLSESAARLIDGYHDGVTPVWIEEIKLLIPDRQTDSLFRNTRVMDCLGNPASLKGHSISIWSSRDLPQVLYVANDLYLQEDFDRVYICWKEKSKNPRYHMVISGIESRTQAEALKAYFLKKGYLRAAHFSI